MFKLLLNNHIEIYYKGFALNKLSEEIAFGLMETPSFRLPMPVKTILSPGESPSEIK